MYFTATASVAAGASATPLSTWANRIPRVKGLLELLINATGTGMVMSLTTGSESIVQADTPVSGGGTAGTLPARLNTEVIADRVDSLDEIVLTLRNTSAGALTYNIVAVFTPTS